MELIHCVYCSACAVAEFGPPELNALLVESRRRNAAADISGILLYHERSFFQLLEGDRAVVEALYAKIAIDKRHNRVTKIIQEPIAERDFPEWTMGYPSIKSKDLREIPGLNDFYAQGKSYLDLGPGRAKTLLAAFKGGRWRASLS